MKKIATLLTMVTVAMIAVAQMANPVTFTSQLKTTNGSSEGEIVFTGKIDKGWHVYSTNLGDAGPTEAAIVFHKKDGVEPVGKLKAVGKEISQFDEMFGAKLRYFENNVQFVQKVKFTSEQALLLGDARPCLLRRKGLPADCRHPRDDQAAGL